MTAIKATLAVSVWALRVEALVHTNKCLNKQQVSFPEFSSPLVLEHH